MGKNSGVDWWEGLPKGKTSHGYIVVKVGPDHHLATTNGWAYEHRLMAEEILGRRLIQGEQVHHRNGIKSDNLRGNISICASPFIHRVKHRRKVNSGLMVPGEPNVTVTCGCGCGKEFPKYDDCGRPREYLSGHNPHRSPSQDAVMNILRGGPKRVRDIIRGTGLTKSAAAMAIKRLASNKKIVLARPRRPKLYGLPGTEININEIVQCGCGCGEEFKKYDKCGRPRSFVSGHNRSGVKQAPNKARYI